MRKTTTTTEPESCPRCGWDMDDVRDDPEWHAEHCASAR